MILCPRRATLPAGSQETAPLRLKRVATAADRLRARRKMIVGGPVTQVMPDLIMSREMMFPPPSPYGNKLPVQYRLRVKSETGLQLARAVRRASCRFRRPVTRGSSVVANR